MRSVTRDQYIFRMARGKLGPRPTTYTTEGCMLCMQSTGYDLLRRLAPIQRSAVSDSLSTLKTRFRDPAEYAPSEVEFTQPSLNLLSGV